MYSTPDRILVAESVVSYSVSHWYEDGHVLLLDAQEKDEDWDSGGTCGE